MERGKASHWVVSNGSNTRVKAGSGSLYSVTVSPTAGSAVRIEDSLNLGAAPDLNAAPSNTTIAWLGYFTTTDPRTFTFGRGIGFQDGLTLAATSNTRVAVEYE